MLVLCSEEFIVARLKSLCQLHECEFVQEILTFDTVLRKRAIIILYCLLRKCFKMEKLRKVNKVLKIFGVTEVSTHSYYIDIWISLTNAFLHPRFESREKFKPIFLHFLD